VTTTHRWFVTSQFETQVEAGRQLRFLPSGTVHAKTFGTSRTRCGLPSNSWPKFFERSFLDEPGERCPSCARGLENELRSGRT